MVEMSDDEYRGSGLAGLLWFVLGVPFGPALRRRTWSVWLAALPLAVVYELFAVPLVVGSVVAVVVLTSPMAVIAAVLRARQGRGRSRP